MADPKTIIGEDFGKLLIDAGIIPPKSRRVIIDASVGEAVTIYVEQYGDDRLLRVGLEDMLTGVAVDMGLAEPAA